MLYSFKHHQGECFYVELSDPLIVHMYKSSSELQKSMNFSKVIRPAVSLNIVATSSGFGIGSFKARQRSAKSFAFRCLVSLPLPEEAAIAWKSVRIHSISSGFGANDEDDMLCVPIATYLIDVNKLMLLVLSKIGLD